MSIAKQDKETLSGGWINVTAIDYSKTYDVNVDNSYGQLKEAVTALGERWGILYDEFLKKDVNFRWIISKDYNAGQGSVSFKFHPDIIPYITLLKERFTHYELKYIAKMSSVYGIRIYELLKQWIETKKTIELSLIEIRKLFDLSTQYSAIKDFKKYVLDIAIKQINQHSDLTCSYTQRKTGRNVTHLTFNFDRKPEATAATEPKTKPTIKRATKPTVQSAAPNPNQTSKEVKQALRELLAARKKITPPEIKTKPEPPPATSSPARSLASIMNEIVPTLQRGNDQALAPGF